VAVAAANALRQCGSFATAASITAIESSRPCPSTADQTVPAWDDPTGSIN
jgi:hypothetical protein